MEHKYYWLASFLEKWPDGAVQAYQTAIHCETLIRAAEVAGAELHVRAKASGTECLLYSIGLADGDVADLVGKAKPDTLNIDWPE
jgi:hypothetical protein